LALIEWELGTGIVSTPQMLAGIHPSTESLSISSITGKKGDINP